MSTPPLEHVKMLPHVVFLRRVASADDLLPSNVWNEHEHFYYSSINASLYVYEVLKAGHVAQRMGLLPGSYVLTAREEDTLTDMGHTFMQVSDIAGIYEGPKFWENSE